MKCARCKKEIDKPVASISGEVMGDEYIESYYFCDQCRVYTKEGIHDRFDGEESGYESGPISKKDGDEKVGLIKSCPEPMEKKCQCTAHLKYFRFAE